MAKDQKTKKIVDNKPVAKKQEHEELVKLQKELEILKKEKIDLLTANHNYEVKLAEYEKQVTELNKNFINQVNEKASQAQKILDQKLKEYQDKYQKEAIENKKYALSDSVADLISIINQFDNLINHPTDDPKIKNYLSSLKMFSNLFQNWLASVHVTPIKVNVGDIYDPHKMDAIDIIGEKSKNEFVVNKILSCGYQLYDRVIIPTKVVVEAKKLKN